MTRARALALGIALTLLSPAIASAQTYNQVFVFGTSLTDQGNAVAAATGVPALPPPFFEGNLGNGPNAAQLLASAVGVELAPSLHLVGPTLGTNFSGVSGTATPGFPNSFDAQIDAALVSAGGTLPADALYVVYAIGAADVSAALEDRRMSSLGRLLFVRAAADRAAASVERLVAAGARNLLIVNVPDVGLAPVHKRAGTAFEARRLAETFNEEYAEELEHVFADPRLHAVFFDLFEESRQLVARADLYGFEFTDVACLPDIPSAILTGRLDFTPACEQGLRADDFVFFGDAVLSGRAENRIARALFAVVPAPIGGL